MSIIEKLLILYYSGVGNTRKVSEWMHASLTKDYETEIYSIEKLPRTFDINHYSAIIIGFPTIHSEPAKPIMMFLDRLPVAKSKISTFLFTTCGLYSTNTLRIFAKKCISKGLLPVLNRSYRCSAIDGILLTPFLKCWYRNEKNLKEKIEKDFVYFIKLNKDLMNPKLPRIKWYSLLNYPNKLLGMKYRFKIYLHKTRCSRCGTCHNNCPTHAIDMDQDHYPRVDRTKCINCYRCIYHCPKHAFSLSKKPIQHKLLFQSHDL